MKKMFFLLLFILSVQIANAQYCTPSYYNYSVSTGSMSNFLLYGYSGTTINDAGPASAYSTGYTDRTTVTGDTIQFLPGGTYSGTVTYGGSAGYTGNQIWIDFNDNGTFETSEAVSSVAPTVWGTSYGSVGVTVNIPTTANGGYHRMRVRNVWYYYALTTCYCASSALSPCNNSDASNSYYSGVTADYTCKVGCPFSISASNSGPICSGGSVTLTGSTTATGGYYWSGPSSYSSTLLSPTISTVPAAATYTFTAYSSTCTTSVATSIGIIAAIAAPTVTPASATICNGGSQLLTATLPPSADTALRQDFNSGLGSWTVTNTGSSGTVAASPWQIQADGYTYSGNVFHSPDNTSFAITNADVGGSGSTTVSRLISPTFSLVGYTAASLSFQTYYRYISLDNFARVQISTDGGATYTTLTDYTTGAATIGTYTGFVSESYSLTSYLGLSNLKVRFVYNSGWGWYWALDNILVSGTIPALSSPTWTPITDLYMDAGFTIPYTTGTATTTVYVHPTTVSSTTTTNYIATLTGSGCSSSADTAVITVNPTVAAISGTATACIGTTTTLSETTTGGTWSSSATSIATVSSSGVVTGVAVGTANIIYTIGSCSASYPVTITNSTSTITGTLHACVGNTSTLSDSYPGGTWSSTSTGVATISSGGVVSALSGGTTTISYAISGGCAATATFTSNTTPVAISGTTSVCVGSTTSLSDATLLGTWSSSSTPNATINSSGVVTGVAAGSSIISYSLGTGCLATTTVTVNDVPASITGIPTVCAGGGTTTLAETSTGGSWSSSSSNATVSSTGVVTGVTAGSAIISYTYPSGCAATITVTINPLPSSILGTPNVCEGYTTTLTDGTLLGTWSSSATAFASIDPSGIVTGVAAGSAVITYTLPTTCYITQAFTVNPMPAAISGTDSVCTGATMPLTEFTGGGTWTSSATSVGTVSSLGVVSGVTAGTTTITYTLSGGCYVTYGMLVNASPASISGAGLVCAGGSTITLSDGTTGGTWTVSSGSTASVDPTGIVTGVSSGTSTISYTMPNSCFATTNVTIYPTPGAISGVDSMCTGTTTTFTDALSGGTWSSSSPSVASISTGGIVSGLVAGSATITYTTTGGCYVTHDIQVNSTPFGITGAGAVCTGGATITLADGLAGGSWTSSVPSVAMINTTGVLTGLASGTTTVTYMMPSTCFATTDINVNPIPSVIAGADSVCTGSSVSMTDTSTGGTWTSSSSFIASIDASGLLSGLTGGNTTVTYTTGLGCFVTHNVHVNITPAAISGSGMLCAGGGTITLTDPTPSGAWSLSAGSTASISATGVVTGITAGSSTVSYIMPSGCFTSSALTINPLPAVITGPNSLCFGGTITLADTTSGGTWSTSSAALATISSGGVLSTVSFGTVTVTYTTASGCYLTYSVLINPIPLPISGSTGVCLGSTTVLTAPTVGGTWSVSPSTTATISSAGVISGLAIGTASVTYTMPSGCTTGYTVSVSDTPAAITGVTHECVGSTTTLSNTTSGGLWSTPTTFVGSVSSSGVVTGVSAGTVVVTYTTGSTGCYTTAIDTVYDVPASITGAAAICVGTTTTYTDATSGGTWSSTPAGTVTIDPSTGALYGAALGTALVTYTITATGCTAVTSMAVNPLPSNISGPTVVCANGGSIALSDITSGGSWHSSNPGVASISLTTGAVTGINPGIDTIIYNVAATGCATSMVIQVNPVPAAIGGVTQVCEAGSTTTLTDATPSCVWGIAPTSIATISATGVVTGVSAGTAMVSYIVPATGCYITVPVTVNPLPAAITGSPNVCVAASTTLASTSPLGTWTSGTPAIATIGGGTGAVTGVASGTTIITYTLPTGCRRTATETVNPIPAAITGSSTACVGLNTPMSDATASGAWTSSLGSIATVDATGLVHGVAVGTTNITYMLSGTSCYVVHPVTVNPIVPPSISISSSAPTTLCAGTPVTYTANPVNGGTAPTFVWSVDGVISAGGSTYTYAPANGDHVRVWFISNYACVSPDTASAIVTMVVHPVVTPTVSISTGTGDTLCQGSAATFGAIATGFGTGPIYHWAVNTTPVTGTSSYTYVPANGDVVKVTLISNQVCRTADSATGYLPVTVSPYVTPSVTINADMGASTCDGQVVTYTGLPVNGGFVPSYVWAVNGVTVSTSSTYSYLPTNGDLVTLLMTSSFPCLSTGAATNSMSMVVSPVLLPTGYLTVDPGDIISAGTMVTFTMHLTSGGGSSPHYQWYNDGGPIAGATNYVYNTNTLHSGDSIKCIVTNNDPCSTIATFNAMQVVVGPNVGVVNVGGNMAGASIQPNPNTGSFTLKGSTGKSMDETAEIEVTDMLGKVVYQRKALIKNGELEEQISLQGTLASGMYLINIRSQNISTTLHFVLDK